MKNNIIEKRVKSLELDSRNRLKHILIFCSLMCVILLGFFVTKILIENVKERERWSKEYISDTEFLRTVDCAPIIDKHGVGIDYEVSFDIKTNIPGEVIVYFLDGVNTKYQYEVSIESTTEYVRHTIKMVPQISNPNMQNAYLAFYGYYGSGVKPSVRNLSFRVEEDE